MLYLLELMEYPIRVFQQSHIYTPLWPVKNVEHANPTFAIRGVYKPLSQ